MKKFELKNAKRLVSKKARQEAKTKKENKERLISASIELAATAVVVGGIKLYNGYKGYKAAKLAKASMVTTEG